MCFCSLCISAADVCMCTVKPVRGEACWPLYLLVYNEKRCLLLRVLRAEHIFTPCASVIKVLKKILVKVLCASSSLILSHSNSKKHDQHFPQASAKCCCELKKKEEEVLGGHNP